MVAEIEDVVEEKCELDPENHTEGHEESWIDFDSPAPGEPVIALVFGGKPGTWEEVVLNV